MFCNRDENTSHVTVATQGNRELVDKLRKKFNEEAKAVFQMNHPNIVRVLDIFEENGTAYYVMEYIDGKSLNDILKERGTLPEAEAVGYIRQVADALKYVHSLNRLHLDIKPGNIMVDKNGKAILIDFGASKHYDDESGENTSTLMGVNTKGYAPIEQSTQSFISFSPATDIYALGATLYKLLTGIVPPDANLLLAEEETLQPLPSNISSATRNAAMSAMALLRKDRLKSVEEFVQSLCSKDVISYKLDSPVLGEDTLLDYSQKNRNETTTDSISYRNYSVALESIASEGDANAQKTLADCFAQGLGIDKNMVSALYWYSKAAEQGHIDAQYEMGICYEKGIGTEKDEKKAIHWYTKAAEQRNVAAMNSLGAIFFQSPNGSKKRIQASLWYKQAFDIYLQSAEQGDIESQRMLAKYYAEGLGIELDKARAEYWYTKVAAQGNIEDQKLLAKLYQNGQGILQNIDNAMGWYTKAAEQGDLASQRILAEYYSKTKIDFDKAEYWYSLAADQGHPEDYIALGNLFRDNDAQKSKLYLKKAFDLYSISAEQGDSWAQLQLGRLYKKGEGVKKDSSKAKYWFKRVIKQNDSNQNNAKEELKDYIWVGMGSIWKIIKCLCFCFFSGFMTVVIASIFWKNIIEHPLFCVILFVLGILSFMGYCLKNWGSWDK